MAKVIPFPVERMTQPAPVDEQKRAMFLIVPHPADPRGRENGWCSDGTIETMIVDRSVMDAIIESMRIGHQRFYVQTEKYELSPARVLSSGEIQRIEKCGENEFAIHFKNRMAHNVPALTARAGQGWFIAEELVVSVDDGEDGNSGCVA